MSRLSGWRAVNGLFLASTTLEALAFGHLTAFTPLFLAELGLASDDVVLWTGLLFGAMMGIAFPLAPFWGPLAERYSRRLIIVRAQYIEAAGYALTAFAPDVWWLLMARMLLGFSFGNIAVVIATQTLLTPSRHVGSAIATIQIAAPVAAALGPPLGAVLIGSIGLRGLFVLDALGSLLAALLVTFLMPEPAERDRTSSLLAKARDTAALVWTRPVLRWNFLAAYLAQGGRVVVDAYLPLRITQLVADPVPVIGFVLGVYGVLTSAATWLAGRLVDENGGVRWFFPAMLLGTVSSVGVALVSDLSLFAAFAWSRALTFAATGTLLYAHLARVLPPAQQTVVMALTPMPRNVAMFSLPLVAAAVAPLGLGAAFAVGAAAHGGAAAVGWLLGRATVEEIRPWPPSAAL